MKITDIECIPIVMPLAERYDPITTVVSVWVILMNT